MARDPTITDSRVREFSISACGLSITVSGDCLRTVLSLQRHLVPWLPRLSDPSTHTRHLLFSIWLGSAPDRFRLEQDHSLLDSDVAENCLPGLLQRAIEEAIVENSRDFVAVHSGVVVYNGVAVLLPGQSRSGKTTLVRELIARGAEYSSDEFAMIDALGEVHPWPRALMIRDTNSDQRAVPAPDLGATVRCGPTPPGLIVFLQHDPNARFDIHPVNQSGALFGLLRNTPHCLADSPHILRPLGAVARAAVAFEGVRGEAAQAADELLRMIPGLL
jgi:hypothetical protein